MDKIQSNENRKIDISEIEIAKDREGMPKNFALAMAYIPFQLWNDDLYEGEEALQKGTIFPELYKPFLRGRSFKKNE